VAAYIVTISWRLLDKSVTITLTRINLKKMKNLKEITVVESLMFKYQFF